MLSWAICFSLPSNAQTVNADGTFTTDNLITNPNFSGTAGWTTSGMVGGNPSEGGGISGYTFSYQPGTISQSFAINQALSAAGTGIQIYGFDYGFQYQRWCANQIGGYCSNANGVADSLSYTATITSSNNQVLYSNSQDLSGGLMTSPSSVNVNQRFSAPQSVTNLGSFTISISGQDNGFWGGNYGPTVSGVYSRAVYGTNACAIDPLSSPTCEGYAQAYHDLQCSSNPLYASTCPGYAQAYYDLQCSLNPLYDAACPLYNTIVTGPNIAPGAGTFAISTALSHSGTGINIFGFKYGFDWSRGNGKCYDSFLFFCTDYRTYSQVKPTLTITNGDGSTILSRSWNFSGDGSDSGGVRQQTIFYGTSYNSLDMGNITWTKGTTNVGSVKNFFAQPLMAPDQCAIDPLSSTLCSGYEAAFLAFQCSISQLYSPQCPEYTTALQAMLDEQAAIAAAATTSTTTTTQDTAATTGSNDGTALTSSSDTTSSPAAVTTDAGGVDVSATGEIKAQDGVPEVVKETKTAEKSTDEKVAVETTDKKEKEKKTLSTSQLLAMAKKAADDREARAVAEKAEKESASESANPSDGGTGTNLASLGTGISLPGFSMKFGGSSDTSERNESTATKTITNNVDSQQVNNSSSTGDNDNKQQSGSSVKKNVQPNKLAGDETTLASLTQPPADFNSYLTAQMRDAQFYQSKDIYKGQKNVDNARLLRGLTGGSDRLHDEMVQQQYRK